MTLRRGAGIIGNALGDFFGVTEVSQRGNTAEGRLGWEQYSERRLEEVREGNGERERGTCYTPALSSQPSLNSITVII